MSFFKTSISLPPELNAFLEEVMSAEGHRNRSLVIQKALRLLRRSRHRKRQYLKRTRQASRAAERSAQESGFLAEETPGIYPGQIFPGAGEGQHQASNAELPASHGPGSAPCLGGDATSGREAALSSGTAPASREADLHADTEIARRESQIDNPEPR